MMMRRKNFKKWIAAAAMAAVITSMAGCGAGNVDAGSSSRVESVSDGSAAALSESSDSATLDIAAENNASTVSDAAEEADSSAASDSSVVNSGSAVLSFDTQKLVVTVTCVNSWQDGTNTCRQYSASASNRTGEDLDTWKFRIDAGEETEVLDSWNCTLAVSGTELGFSPASYNQEVAEGAQVTDIGFILSMASDTDLSGIYLADPAAGETSKLTEEERKEYVRALAGGDGSFDGSGSFAGSGAENGESAGDVDGTGRSTGAGSGGGAGKSASAGSGEGTGKSASAGSGEGTGKSAAKGTATDDNGTPLENHGALRVDGTDLVDEHGDPYQLRGVSTHGIGWFPEYVNEDAFRTLRDDWGANLIRLAVYTAESAGYTTVSDAEREKLDETIDEGVRAAHDLGMYVIIDWHILSDGNPNEHLAEAETFFREKSELYAGYDNVLYEICNEPNGGTTWSDVKSYAENVIPVIREEDPDAVIIVGTPTWSQDVDQAAADPITGYENVMYALHFYAATHKDDLRKKAEDAIDAGLPIFITEFSICDASGNGGVDYDSAAAWRDLIRKYNLSFAGWNLSNKNETSALLLPGTTDLSGWTDDELSETGLWLKSLILEG